MANLKITVALTLLLAGSLLAGDLTGKWSGTTVGKTPDGQTMHDSVWMSLTQTGATVTGTAGPSADRQSPIKEGKVDGDQVMFKVAVENETVVVTLKRDGDTMKGQADVETPEGKLVVSLELQRQQ